MNDDDDAPANFNWNSKMLEGHDEIHKIKLEEDDKDDWWAKWNAEKKFLIN